MNEEMQKEQTHFDETMEVIRENVREYERKAGELKLESDQLFRAVRGGDTELYNQLMTSLSLLESTKNVLRKNRDALNKPYFGRVDFRDFGQDTDNSLYIGKNGVSKNQDVVIVDWRAPVSSVYYENEIGEGSYEVPGGDTISIDLQLKRTYDTDLGQLNGYYDNDVASNDELLVKYLAKNKDAVLGDIIATIQKEQNEIIRDNPFKNVIVQGVAGSGKTTVAMHRISYILYNYQHRFTSNEFCIIGSNDMLLSYITSGLPELDVSNVKHMRMDVFFTYLLGKEWKKKYKVVDNKTESWRKSKMDFVLDLEHYLRDLRQELLIPEDIKDRELGLILAKDNIMTTLALNEGYSIARQAALLNERIKTRIKFLVDEEEKENCRIKEKEYKNFFDPLKGRHTGMECYKDFLEWYEAFRGISMTDTIEQVKKGRFDVYDTAALALIQKRLTAKKDNEEFGQIIVDEAQDFGEMVYYVQKQVLDGCYFTIMGDVSQNINYETGMNDWDNLKKVMFDRERDSFRLLAKSYRNTIEISEFAGRVLEKASAGAYKIQPVIRHGKPVQVIKSSRGELVKEAAKVIEGMRGGGYDTIAVICRTKEEADKVKLDLGYYVDFKEGGEEIFKQGVMVLPIELTKGLEFDCVILWRPENAFYGDNKKDAKLLYVAITRALHRLCLIGTEDLSPLLLG